jgi:hypothetical protein
MQISYGVGDMEYNQRLMHVAEAVARGFVEAAIPGRYLVNTLPFLKYVPAWFPGAGWRRRLKKLTAINDRLLSEPYEDAKVRAVRLGTFLCRVLALTSLVGQGNPERLPQYHRFPGGALACSRRPRICYPRNDSTVHGGYLLRSRS